MTQSDFCFLVGHYMYTKASNVGLKAILRSPEVSLTKPGCLRFYYMAYGISEGRLDVARIFSPYQTRHLFTATTTKNRKWMQVMLDIPAGKYHIHFQTTRTEKHKLGDFAVDDIHLYTQSCRESGEYLMYHVML